MRKYDFKNIVLKEKLTEMMEYAKTYEASEDQKSYLLSYDSFVKFFKDKQELDIQDVIIGMSFTYSWMPTMLTITLPSNPSADIVAILNKAKNPQQDLEIEELEKVQKVINNSMVGASKLLHFINPEKYPIIDSRVCQFLFGNSSDDRLKDPKFYKVYMTFMSCLVNCEERKDISNNLEALLGKRMTDIRSLEFCMYGVAVKKAENKKKEAKDAKKAS